MRQEVDSALLRVVLMERGHASLPCSSPRAEGGLRPTQGEALCSTQAGTFSTSSTKPRLDRQTVCSWSGPVTGHLHVLCTGSQMPEFQSHPSLFLVAGGACTHPPQGEADSTPHGAWARHNPFSSTSHLVRNSGLHGHASGMFYKLQDSNCRWPHGIWLHQ